MTTKAKNEQMVAAIRELARKNYSRGHGWQVIEECLSDEEIVEVIIEGRFPLTGRPPKSVSAARRAAKEYAALKSERFEEVTAEIF